MAPGNKEPEIHLLPEEPSDGWKCRKAKAKQEFTITYIRPDFLVWMVDGSKRLIEVKPSKRLINDSVRRKMAVAQLYAKSQGWSFSILTEAQLRAGSSLANIRILNRFWNATLAPELSERIEAHVPSSGIPLGVLCQDFQEENSQSMVSKVLHLLAIGRLSFDPANAPLTGETLIFPKGAIAWNLFPAELTKEPAP